MTDSIIVYIGSKKGFEKYLEENVHDDEAMPFMELIQQYNARLRPNESGVKDITMGLRIQVDTCIVHSDDYGSVLPHVLSNFTTIVTLNHDIGTLYVHNPPRRVLESLRAGYGDELIFVYEEYPSLSRDLLKKVYLTLDTDVLGQEKCKKHLISGLYRLIKNSSGKPVVMMLYGPSGVGKTESAKSISKVLGGELLRVQFSMMQTEEAYNYVFGSEHSKSSFAKDMMGRESNVVLIDEFDKVNPAFYNAFYELFDEGTYVDTNYNVQLGQTVFLLTCNFLDEEEIKKRLGPAMFSRIGCCIQYEELSTEHKKAIINTWYSTILSGLDDDEREYISGTNIAQWFITNAGRYDNIRILKTKLENAVFDKLTEKFILQREETSHDRGEVEIAE